MVESRRTVIIPLGQPTAEEHVWLQQTQEQYEFCQNRASDYAWSATSPANIVTSKRTIEAALYDELRCATDGLHANLVQKAIKDVTSAMETVETQWQQGERVSKPVWDRDVSWAMTYDMRAATFSKHEVSLATTQDRVVLPYHLPAALEGTPFERYVLSSQWEPTTSTLVYDDGEYCLHLSVKRSVSDAHWSERVEREVSDAPDGDTVRVLGVDLNVHNYTAVTSAAGFYGNADRLNHRRAEYEALRAQLQQTATQSATRRYQARRGVEAAWFEQYAHEVANGIIADALMTNATHVIFEELQGIRERMADAPTYQHWMFDRIQEYVEYKLEPYGVVVETVDPAYTSRQCSHTECQHVSEANRSGREFCCTECGLALNADYNAARNIGMRYLREETAVPSSQTCSTGKATSQLALMSGTLSPTGQFESRHWVTTDKPTTSVVGS